VGCCSLLLLFVSIISVRLSYVLPPRGRLGLRRGLSLRWGSRG